MNPSQHVSIIAPDSMVIVDGVGHSFDFDIDPAIWAVHWDVALNAGHVEYADGSANESIADFAPFQDVLDQLQAHLDSIPPSPLHVADGAGGWKYNLEKVRDDQIGKVKEACGAEIQEQYPLWKQINIDALQGYTQAYKDAMWQTINAARDRSDTLEADINAVQIDADTTLEQAVAQVQAIVW